MKFDHFTIRLLTGEDSDAYFQLIERNRPRLEGYFAGTVSKTKSLEDTLLFIAENMQRIKDRTYFPYLIVDDSSNRIAGFIDLKNIDWKISKSEMGCYMDMDYVGKGIATKAFPIFCDFCFAEYHFKKLFLRTHESNTSARRLVEQFGFEIEGTIRRDYITTSGEIVDLIYYGRLG